MVRIFILSSSAVGTLFFVLPLLPLFSNIMPQNSYHNLTKSTAFYNLATFAKKIVSFCDPVTSFRVPYL